VKFALTFGQLNPRGWQEAALAADELGFESLWLPEHLVLPVEMRGQLVPGEEHPPIAASTPVFDVAAYLGWLAAQTTHVRLGTFVYLLAIRHPFVGARAFATLDGLSGGRIEAGVGAGWMTTEWDTVGLDPSTRGRRLDEAIDVCRRLWSDDVIEHHGEFYDFAPVMFEPKPVQQRLPIVIGGESRRALRRAAERGDGWIGMFHTPDSAWAQVELLRQASEVADREGRGLAPVQVTCVGTVATDADVAAWEAAGVDRLIVVPWARSREALAGIETFAARWCDRPVTD
jgi:probable F420-dependent oxidoreductase